LHCTKEDATIGTAELPEKRKHLLHNIRCQTSVTGIFTIFITGVFIMKEISAEGCRLIDLGKDHLTLTTEDERELPCSIVGAFETPEHTYIVLIPEDGSTEGRGYLMRFSLTEDGMPDLTVIADDSEYETASGIFRTLTGKIQIEE
jgi:hypothetical protein